MNAMTIILSVSASLLVATLILFWQNDNQAAKEEPAMIRRELKKLRAENAVLKQRIEAGQKAQDRQRMGYTSSYRGLESQKNQFNDKKKFEENNKRIAQYEDRNKLVNSVAKQNRSPASKGLEAQTQSSSALDEALSNKSNNSNFNRGEAPESSDQVSEELPSFLLAYPSEKLSESQLTKRRNEIQDARTHARVSLIKADPELGNLILAKLSAPDIALSIGSILAVRKAKKTIAGNIKIIDISDYGESGTFLSIKPVLNGSNLILEKNDELILPPTWLMR